MRLALSSIFVAVAACGGGSQEVEVQVTPFTEEHAAVFEDGIDFVADPEGLEGRWREDWSRELDQRVSWSDVVAVITIRTIRTDTDPNRETTLRLLAEPSRTLLGEIPDEIELKVGHEQAGFSTVEGNDRQILNTEFVAFLKWYQAADGSVRPHWHLAPASDPVMSRVEYLLERRREVPRERDRRTRTVIHEAEE
jgi:hypothetical protein